MKSGSPLVFKFATEDWEFEQIHQLNYRTFVEEIPQHQSSPSHRLVDKFHAENTYLICLCEEQVVGMLAARGARPFSLDQKLENLDTYLPAGRRICEVRLLAVDKNFRGAQVLQGILALLWQHGVERGYDLAIISGTTRQFKLYHHLGFVPFGPLVGTGEAQFQPMFVTLETFEKTAREFLRSSPSRSFQAGAVNFLPGPVAVRREVRRAFEQAPESHRSEAFTRDFSSMKESLRALSGAGRVEICAGSGTLANDVVAAQLSLESGPGIILSNGEFGERLVDHAHRFGLKFQNLASDWGSPLDYAALEKELKDKAGPAWVWAVHCETSTGVLNDLAKLKALCERYGAKLCLDCVSSIGVVPVDLAGVHLASCSSGKGLRSYPGLSMVFYHHEVRPSNRLPRYLDLGYYAAQDGVPFTLSSNLVHALQTALKRVDWSQRFKEIAETSTWLRRRLEELGFPALCPSQIASPAVHTINLPRDLDSTAVGNSLRESGYLLSFESNYLRRRNWIQICLMGECSQGKVAALSNAMSRSCRGRVAVG